MHYVIQAIKSPRAAGYEILELSPWSAAHNRASAATAQDTPQAPKVKAARGIA